MTPRIETHEIRAIRPFVRLSCFLKDSPPERDLEWNVAGIEGSSKFVDRIFFMTEHFSKLKEDGTLDAKSDLSILTHKTIALVSNAIENSRFNKAIALLRELFNAINEHKNQNINCALFAFKSLIKMLNPFMPHFTEEIWHRLGGKEILAVSLWPDFNAEVAKEYFCTIAVQVNGKLRTTMQIALGLNQEEVKCQALNHEKIAPYIVENNSIKIVYVPGKVINLIF